MKFWLMQSRECKAEMGRKLTLINNWKRAHPGGNYREHLEEVYGDELQKCSCGCGERVLTVSNKYIHGHNRPWSGKKRGPIPEAQKQKMRESHVGKKYTVTDEGRAISRENLKKAHAARRGWPMTSLEKKFQGIIDVNHLPYRFVGDGAFIVDGLNPDFINVNGEKIAIEVYARFHRTRRGGSVRKYKAERIKRLSPYGWKVYFFDEYQVNTKHVLSSLAGGVV
jgi:hypothetical protein